MLSNLLVPILLTLLAGLATGVGSLIGLVVKGISPGFLRLMLGFSAGVMLYVSFTELLRTGIDTLGFVGGNLAFFGGIAFIALLDTLIPHEFLAEKIPLKEGGAGKHVLRAGMLTAIGLMIHNFPEGMAVFASAAANVKLGIALAVAIAIHNIPEGIAVSLPIYAATGSRRLAFGVSLLSGLAEPLGALLAGWWIILLPTGVREAVMGGMLAGVGGLMTFISFDEILPLSYHREPGQQETKLAHEAILGIIGGMLVMALSLALFQ